MLDSSDASFINDTHRTSINNETYVPEESSVTVFKPSDIIRDLIILPNYKPEEDFLPCHADTVNQKITNNTEPGFVICYKNRDGKLVITDDDIDTSVNYLFYIIKPEVDSSVILTKDNFVQYLNYASMNGMIMESLLRVLNAVYVPSILNIDNWPSSIKADFLLNLQRFMSALTDFRWRYNRKTVLYLPQELDSLTVKSALKDKNLVMRCEIVLIHWTKQIKEMLNDQQAYGNDKLGGPLNEIEFWKLRAEDMTRITIQLKKQTVLKITQILISAKSSYVQAFLRLSEEILLNEKRAKSNVKFLETLSSLAYALMDCKPNEVKFHVPALISKIRCIWVSSEYFNSPEQINLLFQRLSNEILSICINNINLEDIFERRVKVARKCLIDSMECCQTYENIYMNAKNVHTTYSDFPWVIDDHSILAQCRAFIQRCQDLTQVCECTAHFCRYEKDIESPNPLFMGIDSLEIVNSLENVKKIYIKQLYQLKEYESFILDVKATSWHEGLDKFRIITKDLEIILQNIINKAFSQVRTIRYGVDLLEVFAYLNDRDSIKRTLEHHASILLDRFVDLMNNVRQEVTKNQMSPIFSPTEVHFSTPCRQWRMLKRQVEVEMQILETAHFIPSLQRNLMPVRAQYNHLMKIIEEEIKKAFIEFQNTSEVEISKALEAFIIFRSLILPIPGQIAPNMKGAVKRTCMECIGWLQLRFDLPSYLMDLPEKYTEIRSSYELVLTAVHDYNYILKKLTMEEKGMFKERLTYLDKRLNHGLHKIQWQNKAILEMYINDLRTQISKVQMKIDQFKEANLKMQLNCQHMLKMLMIKIEPGRIYHGNEFQETQIEYRKQAKDEICQRHLKISQYIKKIRYLFDMEDPETMQRWVEYVSKIDKYCELAMRLNLKDSLLVMNTALSGDGRNDPEPLFNVTVNLDDHVMVFMPNLTSLSEIVYNINQEFLNIVAAIPRLTDIFCKGQGVSKESISETLAQDIELKPIHENIVYEMKKINSALQEPLSRWDVYRDIWENTKDIFIQNYRATNPPVADIDADIARYNEISNKIMDADSMVVTRFLQMDFTHLKNSIFAHCRDWQLCLMQLLLDMTSDDINSIYIYMNTRKISLMIDPTSLDQLGVQLQLLENTMTQTTEIQSRFDPLDEQFSILDKCEVEYNEELISRRANLRSDWEKFKEVISASEQLLKKSKERFRAGLMAESDEWRKKVQDLLAKLTKSGPFGLLLPKDALDILAIFQLDLDNLKETEKKIRIGLSIFKIELSSLKETSIIERDIETLKAIWLLNEEWDNCYIEWKTRKFADLQVSDMEDQSVNIYKKITKYHRDFKERDWKFLNSLKVRLERFRKTLPLIMDLKNKAMRPRHWDEVKSNVNCEFDPETDEFSLDFIVVHSFDNYAEVIGEISSAASKELAIEKNLANIDRQWQALEMDTVPYKDKGHFKIRSMDEAIQILEDNQVQLTTMKASRFVKPFEHLVDGWERTLTKIGEIVDALLLVQRQWLYLETIFMGEDIRKQLPRESASFDAINNQWKEMMIDMNTTKNIKRCTEKNGLYKQLLAMSQQLEDIQKCLDMYLETKRYVFPRFYFISNDDLLEILGQGRNPEAVMPHLKKCFDNLVSAGLYDASSMFSADGEEVPLKNKIRLDGPVENWLCDVEDIMRRTLKDLLRDCRAALRKNPMKCDKLIKEWPGQMCITSSQLQWTADVTKGLQLSNQRQDKKPMKTQKKKQRAILEKLSVAIRSNLTSMQRIKINSLAVIEVHQRDIIEKLYKVGCLDINAFDWLAQLRFYWEKDVDDCVIRQTISTFLYAYEYLGNSGRLVITPLTDRCYITLTTALHMFRGGSPKGPAGTGKTETTKDLGKSLGMYVIVVNCSEGLDYKSMGRMFSGLAQTGAWGCFDEFNRINIEVLSVVAQQILSILSALSLLGHQYENPKKGSFMFEGTKINLIWSCGMFITMNPGYAGRTELPDNLKSMFRPIAMVVPDSTMIAEITLFAEGFGSTKLLAKKVYTLYSLSVQQLSKQDHYDFGLRALVSVLRYAGRKRRANPQMNDEEVLLLSMNDMNLAKLTLNDLPLFKGIVSDLFPGIDIPSIDYTKFNDAFANACREQNLQPIPFSLLKTIQLYETQTSRHSVMIVGKTLSGKSTTWKLLKSIHRILNDAKEPGWNKTTEYPINPKSVSLGELYGEFNLATNEWSDGILSSVMRNCCSDDKTDVKWVLFDGPVDAVWIESMNSVMDDNKILTLINGERISMPPQVTLLFEVEDLAVASPATVSRCGMVYNDVTELGYWPFINSWLNLKTEKILFDELKQLCEKYVDRIINFINSNCNNLIPVASINTVISLTRIFDSIAISENGFDTKAEPERVKKLTELYFQFAIIWSLCGSLDSEGRKRVDTYLREIEGTFPNKDTIYEYYVNSKGLCWSHWEEMLQNQWVYDPEIPFYMIIVPTVDTVRYNYLVSHLIQSYYPVLLVGPVGTGKTSIIQNVLDKLDKFTWSSLTINMSAQTSSNNVQDIIEGRLEKRSKGVYVPVGGKKMLTVMDDFNMPAKDTYGSQPPLELMRQWLDYGFWYNRQKQTVTHVASMYLLSAMGPPGGGRMVISRRLQSKFNTIVLNFPTPANLIRIFGSMLTQKMQNFEEEPKSIINQLTDATIDLYNRVVSKFLPTPTKIHYLFNLRDISKVFQGLLRAEGKYHDSKSLMLRLWLHEAFRVFSDRLVDEKDSQTFYELLSEQLATYFDTTFNNTCPTKTPPIFADFMNPGRTYEDVTDLNKLRSFLNNTLDEYNNTPGTARIELVLFRDAMEHVCKLVRVITQARGNMLFIGIGGSGRRSLARLAAYLCGYKTFQIEITKHYKKSDFREDLKKLYLQCGVQNRPSLFIFLDTQVAEESFLEDINNMLSSGEVPNLFKQDEFEEIRNELSDVCRKEYLDDSPQTVFRFLIDRVKTNLHIVLCMSPIGEPFRNRMRMYPSLINCTTIDWFSEWPEDALLEVANKYLLNVSFWPHEYEDKIRKVIARVCSKMHKSVSDMSNKMFLQLKRKNYVTPTNYLELVSGYKTLLDTKRKDLFDQAQKLKNGLSKIDETREKVEVMFEELAEAREKVQQFQKECDEYLVILVQQKREADEQAKAVTITKEKISVEEAKCMHMAELAHADLALAMPALEDAIRALEALNKKDITEIKSYGKPPQMVEIVMSAVMILRGAEPTWAEAKKHLSDPDFIKQLINFDKDNISDRTLKKITQFCAQDNFQPDFVGRQSLAAKSLCMWVRAMEVYGRVYRVVEPKRQRLAQAEAILREKQEMLAAAQAKLDAVMAEMTRLQAEYNDKMAQKEELRRKAEYTEKMLDRANKLVTGLASEKDRWEQTVAELERKILLLPGDCILACAFMSYCGPFLSEYRDELIKYWYENTNCPRVPCSDPFLFTDFMADPTLVREWNIQGLPRDNFSIENGVMVTLGNRWPLMVDPQCQAQKWIKSMMGKKLKIIDLMMPDYMRILENSIREGDPVLLQNIGEYLDPALDPILTKAFINIVGSKALRLGDKEVEYNPDFKFFITTKLPNPHYSPEICSKTQIVNFGVKLEGLEAQLLGIVVRQEKPELEEQKDNLVTGIAAGKRKLKELEDIILRLLNEAQGSLLDDEELVNTLQTSKTTSTEVTEQLQIAETTEKEIDLAREGYRPCAQRASILFFILNDLGRIEPMYQFALDAYIALFNMSIEKSQRSTSLEQRIHHLNDAHTFAVYRNTCRGLFEKHKLLFSFQICIKILESAGKLISDEFVFFLRGGVVLDRDQQLDNPCVSWLPAECWDNISELEKIANFRGVITSFEQYPRDWNTWYTSEMPESSPLPGDWDNLLNEFQKLVVLRSLRPDRVPFAATTFIINNLGQKFVEPPVLALKQVLADSTNQTPLIFVLSPGVDPTSGLLQLADACEMGNKLNALSLGQGQAPIANRLVSEGMKLGNWVFLANCHLSLSWMPELDKWVEKLSLQEPHKNFRLWLSSSPTPHFPISILQASIKMTTEPPKGIKANMTRLYHLIKDDQFTACNKPEKYKKLLFSLCFFHSILLERRKFLMLGWNVAYEFNDSDFEISEHLLTTYLNLYEDTAWEALKYLIADISYGGHVTDDWDRRLLNTYMADNMKEEILKEPFHKLTSLPYYYVPRDGSLNAYREFVGMLPVMDNPEAFGQHANADITSQIQETRILFDTLLSLQVQTSSNEGQSKELIVMELARNLAKQVPEDLDYDSTSKILASDMSPLNVVLLQEMQRYTSLLRTIRNNLDDLDKGIQGLVVMSQELEDVFQAIHDARIPSSWSLAYNSMKPLGAWARDLWARVDLFNQWASTAHQPKLFWVGAFTFPTGLLTAVMQTSARKYGISVDSLIWEFTVNTVSDANIATVPKDGILVRGLYLQGGGWDMKASCLQEPSPMELVVGMPSILFKPIENKKRSLKNIYICPCYYFPNRSGANGKASFMIAIELKSGVNPPEHWVKRGTALLMSLDN